MQVLGMQVRTASVGGTGARALSLELTTKRSRRMLCPQKYLQI